MKFVNKSFVILLIFCSLIAFPLVGLSQKTISSKIVKKHQTTDWEITPSFTFDVLCFLNTLTGDPFYLEYHKEEYAKFEPKLTPKARGALANLKRKIKDERKDIISAFLSLYFSAVENKTLDDLIRTVNDSSKLQANLKKTLYYDEEGWQAFKSVEPDLKVIFQFLKDIRFYDYWKENLLPKLNTKIAEIIKGLPNYNIIPEVETYLGFALPSNKISVYMLNYTKPHGIRIVGLRFLTDVEWGFDVNVRSAIHEMMHPPYDLKNDKELSQNLDLLKKDPLLMDKVQNHDQSFGYNTVEGLIEEDTIQAIDQIISEKFKVAREAHQRWKKADDGIHVFAVALYKTMKDENYPQNGETLRNFLIRMINIGKLAPGKIKAVYDAFYAETPTS